MNRFQRTLLAFFLFLGVNACLNAFIDDPWRLGLGQGYFLCMFIDFALRR